MPSTNFPQSSGIIPSPGITPPTGAQVTPNFDYSGGSYAPKPDTISSMATFAKKNAKWLAIGTFLLGALYFLWSIFTRKPPTPPTDNSEEERVVERPTRATHRSPPVRRAEVNRGPERIINKKRSELNIKAITSQFIHIYRMCYRKNCQSFMITQPLTALMKNDLQSSESFIEKIQNGDSEAFKDLLKALLDICKAEIRMHEVNVVGVEMENSVNMSFESAYPQFFEIELDDTHPIVTTFAKLMQK